jgi:hypothetical protein
MRWVNQSKFAELAGVSRAAISLAIKRGRVIRQGKMGIDLEDPVNVTYLQSENDSRTRSKKPKKTTKKPKPTKKSKPKPKKLPPASEKAQPVEEVEYYHEPEHEALLETYDLNGNAFIDRATADRLKVIEQARTLEIKRLKERGKLVDREHVSRIFNMLYKIDTGELRPLGDKLAPEVAAICGISGDSEIERKISSYIEDEIYKTLEHIKRRINDGLADIEAEEIE